MRRLLLLIPLSACVASPGGSAKSGEREWLDATSAIGDGYVVVGADGSTIEQLDIYLPDDRGRVHLGTQIGDSRVADLIWEEWLPTGEERIRLDRNVAFGVHLDADPGTIFGDGLLVTVVAE